MLPRRSTGDQRPRSKARRETGVPADALPTAATGASVGAAAGRAAAVSDRGYRRICRRGRWPRCRGQRPRLQASLSAKALIRAAKP